MMERLISANRDGVIIILVSKFEDTRPFFQMENQDISEMIFDHQEKVLSVINNENAGHLNKVKFIEISS